LESSNHYSNLFQTKTLERAVLLSVPWMLDAFKQDPASLQRALILENKRFVELEGPVVFSIITPMYNTAPRLLAELIASVRLQSYPFWELLLRDDASPQRTHLEIARRIAAEDPRIRIYEADSNIGIGAGRDFLMQQAQGDYLVVLDHDDLIHPQTLGVLARTLATQKEVNFIFTNEAKINDASNKVFDFLSKPNFDRFTLHRINYICHLSCTSKKLVDALRARDGFAWSKELDGAEDHDFFLRLSTLSEFRPLLVPLFTYYWRATAGSTALNPRAKASLEERRIGLLKAKLDLLYGQGDYTLRLEGEADKNGYLSIHPRLDETSTNSILVIVPFHNASKLTIRCLESLLLQDCYQRLKVILVNNNSSSEESDLVKAWVEAHPKLNAEVVDYPVAFNFAKINNFGFNRFSNKSDTVLFLNNDVEILSTNAISVMAAHLRAHQECAFVGIRLMYPEGNELQHGGIRVVRGTHGSGYVNIGHATHESEFVYDERVSMGVTFACAMTKCETFRQLEGLEEVLLPNGFGDVDISIRAMQIGKVNHYYGTLVGIHHESKTRKTSSEEFEFFCLHNRHCKTISQAGLRELSMNWQPLLANSLNGFGESGLSMPLRYRLADKINTAIKTFARPVHGIFKKAIHTSAKIVRAIRN
jgi:glycosyltransferase involved in cell wall biosynthesis